MDIAVVFFMGKPNEMHLTIIERFEVGLPYTLQVTRWVDIPNAFGS